MGRQNKICRSSSSQDPTLADFFFENYLRAFFADPPSYNYWPKAQLLPSGHERC